jgi:mRNA-degrading endonuclease RelE of RelBE toxin-antitoxin system
MSGGAASKDTTMEPPEGPAYHVEISAKASADFGALDPEALEAIHQALDTLEMHPQPPGARRRTAPGRYSLRAGLHRILYAVDEEARLVTVERIRRRRAREPTERQR